VAEKIFFLKQVTNIDANDDEVTSYSYNRTTRLVESETETVDKDSVDPVYTKKELDRYPFDDNGTRKIKTIYSNTSDLDGTVSEDITTHELDNRILFKNDFQAASPFIIFPHDSSLPSGNGMVQLRALGGFGDTYEFDVDYPNAPNKTGYFNGLDAGVHTYQIKDIDDGITRLPIITGTFEIPKKSLFTKRYELNFTNDKGNDVEIDILFKNYNGSFSELCGSGNPLTITSDVSGVDDFTKGNTPLSITLTILETEINQLDPLIYAEQGEVQIKIKESNLYYVWGVLIVDNTSIDHRDLPREVSFTFQSGISGFTDEKIEGFTGSIKVSQFFAWAFASVLDVHVQMEQALGLRINGSGEDYGNVLDNLEFPTSIIEGMYVKDAVELIINSLGANLYPVLNEGLVAPRFTLYAPEAIYTPDDEVDYAIFNEVGVRNTTNQKYPDVRSVEFPSKNEIMYLGGTQQLEIIRKIKKVTVEEKFEFIEDLGIGAIKWDGLTLENWWHRETSYSGSLSKFEMQDDDGREVVGITLTRNSWTPWRQYVHELGYVKSVQIVNVGSEGIVNFSWSAKVKFRENNNRPEFNGKNRAEILTQLIISDEHDYAKSLDGDGEFINGWSGFCKTEVTSDGIINSSFSGKLPTIGAPYARRMFILLYDPLMLYEGWNNIVNNDVVEVSYFDVKLSMKPETDVDNDQDINFNDKGDTTVYSPAIIDAPSSNNGEFIYKNCFTSNGDPALRWLEKWRDLNEFPTTTPAPLSELIGHRWGMHRSKHIQRLEATLYDRLPLWNTLYYDRTLGGKYFQVSNFSYDVKRAALDCSLLETVFWINEYLLLESGDNLLLESGDKHKLE
jgi:hypothetical protein